MDKIKYTPLKPQRSDYENLYSTTTNRFYERHTPEKRHIDYQIIKDYQTLKIYVKQLQSQNRNLVFELDKIKDQQNHSENKIIQQLNYEQETRIQFQKQKNYQIELISIKKQQQIYRLKKSYEQELQEVYKTKEQINNKNDQLKLCLGQYEDQLKVLITEINDKDSTIKQLSEKSSFLQLKNSQLIKQLSLLDKQLIKTQRNTEQMKLFLQVQQNKNKDLEKLVYQLKKTNLQMEQQVKILLQIQQEKTKTLKNLEYSLKNAQQNEIKANEKIILLSDRFSQLQDHIDQFKQQLRVTESDNKQLSEVLEQQDLIIKDKQFLIIDLTRRQSSLKTQFDEISLRQKRRERQIVQLIGENERLYKEYNYMKHKLHDFSITYGFDI